MSGGDEKIPVSIIRPLIRCFGYVDFPTAWAVQKDRGRDLKHDPFCSSVPGHDPLSGPAILCDCGAVESEVKRLRDLVAPDA